MATEMTPQDRAAELYGSLNAYVPYERCISNEEFDQVEKESQEDIVNITKAITETSRAALLEAAQMIEDDCYGGVDYFSDADTTLSFTDQMKRAHNKNQAKLAEQVRKLAQEGS